MGYVLFDEIAAGGMAAVHFGRLSGPVGFSRVVAIKRLHKHLARDRDFVAMFMDEARLAARVRHPNVVQTVDVVAEDEVYIVMEYIQGESVSRLVRAEKARGQLIPLPYALAIVTGTLNGLHAAHDAVDERGAPLGLVHRDVSPQNILVGIDGVARVFDFGVAKAAGRLQDTRDGSLKGKVAYMSPEQLAGRPVTRRSDIYSAAVMLWELLAGRRLFEAENEAAIIPKIMSPQLSPPSSVNPAVPPAVDEIVMRGLAFDPERRYATARAMAQELERNGGLVAATEIGEWVSQIAHAAIQKRANRIAEIESRDISDVSGNAPMSIPGARYVGGSTAPPSGENRGFGGATQKISVPPPVSERRLYADPSSAGGGSGQLREYAPEAPTQATPSHRGVGASGGYPQVGASGGFPVAPPELATQGAMSLQPPPKRRGGAVFVLLLLLLLVAGGGFAVWRFAPNHGRTMLGLDGPKIPSPSASQSSAASPPPSASQATGDAPSSSTALIAVPPSTGTATGNGAAPAASAKDAGTASAHPSAQPPGKAPTGVGRPSGPIPKPPKQDECDPPYVIDADGHKVYKRNCLGSP
jgi:serine/threonine-protein kinase